MSIEQPILESSTQQIALEWCSDRDISARQLDALQEHNVSAYRSMARIAGAEVQFKLLAPADVTDNTPIGIVNGYCGSQGAYKRLAVELALRGHNVFYLRPPRTQGLLQTISPAHLSDVLRLQSQAVWAATRTVQHELGNDQTDLYGHSMGAVISAKAASHKQGQVRNMVLAGGAGLNGRNTFLGMTAKAIGVVRHDIAYGIADMQQYSEPSILTDTAYHILRRPDRTIREGYTVARSDIRPQVDRLQAAGTKIGLILFQNDGFFSVESVLEANHGRQFDEIQIIPNTTHVYPQQDPVEHSYDISVMLSDLNPDGGHSWAA